jgi:hypothetical protein
MAAQVVGEVLDRPFGQLLVLGDELLDGCKRVKDEVRMNLPREQSNAALCDVSSSALKLLFESALHTNAQNDQHERNSWVEEHEALNQPVGNHGR